MSVTILSLFTAIVKADNLPVSSANLSMTSDNLLVSSDNLPVSSDNLPVSLATLPVSSENLPVAVIISREIKPFIEMVEGFESSLDIPVVRIFLDQNSSPFSHDPLYKGTHIANYSFVIAVGPLALSYLVKNNNIDQNPLKDISNPLKDISNPLKNNPLKNVSNKGSSLKNLAVKGSSTYTTKKILYAMVLNPETIIPQAVSLCGISLNLFSGETVSKISKVFPFVKRIGVLFDPANNSKWFESSNNSGLFNELKIIPLYIKDQPDVNHLNKDDISNIDALLFIPDKTVTSPTIISHIIKQSIAKNIPVIGYNSFFHKSGAALSFILDYRAIGEQMAKKVIALSQGESCEQSTPAYHMTLNKSVVELLNLELGSSLPLELKVEP